MQNTTQVAACPKCGQTNAQKVNFTWLGGALGPRLFSQVKCQNCGAEYNGKTGKSNQQAIIIYLAVSFLLAFCICGGMAALSVILNSQ